MLLDRSRELALTVAILAGGAATRLGCRDKGLEPLGGRPLVAWVVDAIHAMDAAREPSPSRGGGDGVRNGAPETAPGSLGLLIIANRHQDQYAHYAATLADLTTGFRGPLAGVAAALAACTTPWLLTVPVDCPTPPPDLAARLLDAALAHDGDAFVAHDGERRQPLFALYRRELAAAAAAGAEAGQGVWQWQDAIAARELDFSDRRAQFRNLNTPEDFAAYAAEHRLSR